MSKLGREVNVLGVRAVLFFSGFVAAYWFGRELWDEGSRLEGAGMCVLSSFPFFGWLLASIRLSQISQGTAPLTSTKERNDVGMAEGSK